MTLRAAALLALLTLSCRQEAPASAPADSGKPELSLLTSLPVAFAEGFSLDAPAHPLMQRLEKDYRVTLVDDPARLPPGGLLLAIQPQALTAERLVVLDEWVRKGGRVLLLADPRLDWESSLPIGDKRRPPFSFPDTGLLEHWGLRLIEPVQPGPVPRELGGQRVVTSSPGVLRSSNGSSCRVSGDSLVARCSLGKGRAVVIADADLVQADVPGGLEEGGSENREALAAEIAALRD